MFHVQQLQTSPGNKEIYEQDQVRKGPIPNEEGLRENNLSLISIQLFTENNSKNVD